MPLTSAQLAAAREDPRLANVLYHDWEAASYDEKWSISYDQRCIDYAVGRFRAVAGEAGPYEPWSSAAVPAYSCSTSCRGIAGKGSVTDISPGMVQVALRNAQSLGLDVDGRVADGERLPFDGATFDLVVGHAVLHHIPDVPAALREVLRVLRPGGRFVFAGEPTRIGDRCARTLGRLTWWATTTLTRVPALQGWRRPQQELDESSRAAALEAMADLHTFDSRCSRAWRCGQARWRCARRCSAGRYGPSRPRCRPTGSVRAGLTSPTEPGCGSPPLDERILPRSLGYNLLITGRKPAPPPPRHGDLSGQSGVG